MPHLPSAKKNLRKSLRRRQYNKAAKSAVRTQIKKLERALGAGDAEQVQTQLRATAKKLYQAAAKGIIHRNAAARHLSRLSRKANAGKGQAASPSPAQT